MKINSVYISAFGGLKNIKLDLSNGFNVIYGDNENGKTTLMAFIKMMFYGSERGSASIAKNIRKKYTPWDGSQMAGCIDFEHKGKNYRLEREFRTSNSTDKVTLCDLDIGTRQVVGADIGLTFFGISAAAFERSVFIGQLGFPESDATAEGEINSKLSNMVLTGDESVSFEAVYKRLEKAKLALMSKSGKAGDYDKNVKLYSELTERLQRAESIHSNYEAKASQFAQKEQEIQLLQKNALALKEKIDAEQDVRNAEKLKKYLELKSELDNINEQLRLDDGSLIDEMYLRKLQFCISKVQTAQSKAESKSGEIKTLEKSLEIGLNPPENATQDTADKLSQEIELLSKKILENENKKSALEEEKLTLVKQTEIGKSNKVLIVALIFGLLSLGAIAFSAIKGLLPLLCVSAATLLIIICVYFAVAASHKRKSRDLKQRLEKTTHLIENIGFEIIKLEQETESKKLSLETINTALQSSAAVLERQKSMLNEAVSQLTVLKAEEAQETTALLQLFSKYKTAANIKQVLDSLDEISNKATAQKEIKQQINFISKDLGGISYEDAKQKLSAIEIDKMDTSADFDALKARYEALAKEIIDSKSLLAAAVAETKAAISSAENPKEIEKQLAELRKRIISQKEFCDTADIAMQVLTQSFAEIRRSYGSVLETKAGEIFAGLTSQKYESMSISKSLEINVNETEVFGSREIDYLSSGTADQAYLSLRMALASLVSDNGEKLPLLLDDSLTQYDDVRMKKALDFLNQYASTGQIIMFTCHNVISDSAKELGANILDLKK